MMAAIAQSAPEAKERAKRILWERGSDTLAVFLEEFLYSKATRSQVIDTLETLYPDIKCNEVEETIKYLNQGIIG